MGRPTLYKPEYCEEVVSHMRGGFSLESFAGKIGVHKDSLYAWRDAHEDFSDAIKRAQSACQYFWEHKLVQTVDAPKEMNATSVYFALKCRFGYKETQSIEHSGPDGKAIETKAVSSLTDEQLDAKLAVMLEKTKESPAE